MDIALKNILAKYHVAPDARLSQGMEAQVYAYGSGSVLKLYTGTASLADLRTLKDFYDSLDRQRLPYLLPIILSVTPEEGAIVTIERRLPGTRLSEVLPALKAGPLHEIMQRYLTAALAVSCLEARAGFKRHRLLDPEGLSQRSDGDWQSFLWRYITHKLVELAPYLSRDVVQFELRLQQLRAILRQPYTGEYHLIHGDFFPGNLLVDPENQISGLLDFGLFTLYGDYLFDIATGWVFLDMYDELKASLRERYLPIVLDRLGADVRGRLYRYVLIYSILSANTYSPTCADGHYQWCVANLNTPDYWNAID